MLKQQIQLSYGQNHYYECYFFFLLICLPHWQYFSFDISLLAEFHLRYSSYYLPVSILPEIVFSMLIFFSVLYLLMTSICRCRMKMQMKPFSSPFLLSSLIQKKVPTAGVQTGNFVFGFVFALILLPGPKYCNTKGLIHGD